MLRKNVLAWGVLFLLLLGSVVILGSVLVPPHVYWPAGLASYLIPLVVIVHLLIAAYGLIRRSALGIPSAGLLLVLLIAWINQPDGQKNLPVAENHFTVLSYNASFFHNEGRWKENYESALMHQSSIAMKEWLAGHEADIKCIQEFYNHDDSPIFNTIATIGRQGGYDYFFADSQRAHNWDAGVTIFSRFPIIDAGELLFSRNAYNKAAFADVLIDSDTIRIINVHLQSMGLEASRAAGWVSKLTDYARKIKHGLIARSQQTEVLLKFIEESPYRVIVCGDMNELPFGNAYRRLKSTLYNAHEAAGRGAGFTYNHFWLFFLRIDHQFYDPKIQIHDFQTRRGIKYSDNFPTEATYSLLK